MGMKRVTCSDSAGIAPMPGEIPAEVTADAA